MDQALLQQILDSLPAGVVVIIKLEDITADDSTEDQQQQSELGKDRIIYQGDPSMGGGVDQDAILMDNPTQT